MHTYIFCFFAFAYICFSRIYLKSPARYAQYFHFALFVLFSFLYPHIKGMSNMQYYYYF